MSSLDDIAAGDQQMPDFAAIAEALNDASRKHVSLATHFERMRDIPAFGAGARILEATGTLTPDVATVTQNVNAGFNLMDARFVPMDARLDFMQYTSMARHMNGYAMHPSTLLSPLRDKQNRDVQNFPRDWAAIDAMSSNRINELLTSYGLPIAGPAAIGRRQLKMFTGPATALTGKPDWVGFSSTSLHVRKASGS